jgi:hypothetical protein
MTKSFALLFQMKRTKALPNGNAPIYLRITIDSERVEIATKRNANPDKWNTVAQKVLGNTDEAKSVNSHLKTVEQKAYEVYREMIERNIPITAQTFKDRMNGIEEEVVCRMLIPIFEEHNRQVEALIGKEYAPATAIRYQTTINHVKNFLKWKYKVSDINIQDLDHEFVTSLEFYLRTVRHCNNNSAVKYIKNLKKIIHICVANNWLTRNPFINYKTKIKEPQLKKEYWKLNGKRSVNLKPDVIIIKNECRYVLDTKWKLPNNNKPGYSDLQQMYAYTKYFKSDDTILCFAGNSDEFISGNFFSEVYGGENYPCSVLRIAMNASSPIYEWQEIISKTIQDTINKTSFFDFPYSPPPRR